jgi:hypothetical protein
LAKGKFFTSSAALSAKLFATGAAAEGGLCGGPPAPAMNNFGDGIRKKKGRGAIGEDSL